MPLLSLQIRIMNLVKRKFAFLIVFSFLLIESSKLNAQEEIIQILETIQKDIKTLEKAVYSDQEISTDQSSTNYSEDALTKHLLKLSDIEKQFQEITNNFEELNFKIDKLSNRLSKIQSDNQLRFQDLEQMAQSDNLNTTNISSANQETELPGTSQPQDLGAVSEEAIKNTTTVQRTQSVETTSSVVTEEFKSEKKLLPATSPEEQYEFATSFLKVGDYDTAEVALKEFVEINPEHDLAGNAQYWYAETFRIRQLFTDAASAYLEGYQKYPKSNKAPINLLRLGVSLVQIGEKDQGCSMITGVSKQYPEAKQSVLQKAKYEEKKFECSSNST